MNCGLGNLATLKSYVLPEGQAADTTFDARLAIIGKGVAASLENWCSRKFMRTVNDVFVCSADRSYIALPRYPLEGVATVELQVDLLTGYTTLDQSTLLNLDPASGLINFGTPIGPWNSQLRITFTGGFFFETLEPTDDGYPSAVPDGAAELPADLEQAWLLSAQRIFARTRTTSLEGIKDVTRAGVLLLNLDEEVNALVFAYKRFG